MPKIAIRLSQAIVPFGVGAIFTKSGESFVAVDTTQWPSHGGRGLKIASKRLEMHLNVNALYEPQSEASLSYGQTNAKGYLPYYRFPRALFCRKCTRMVKWTAQMEHKLKSDESPGCPTCTGKLQPMRFIQICGNGHMSDIDWGYWCHSNPGADPEKKQCTRDHLRYVKIPNMGGGLASLEIRCTNQNCQARRSLAGLATLNSLKRLGVKCTGTQPWENRIEPCSETPQVVGATASNVYFPQVESALDIPPYSDHASYGDASGRIRANLHYPTLKASWEASGGNSPILDNMISAMATDADCDEEDVRDTIQEDIGGYVARVTAEDEDLLKSEWDALRVIQTGSDLRDRFVTTYFDAKSFKNTIEFAEVLSDIVQVRKLREVRALVGFNRYERTSEANKFVRVNLREKADWLPAIEVYGEGLFLSLDESKLCHWEALSTVSQKYQDLNNRLLNSYRCGWLPNVTPRFILLHTLSHLIMRELCYECGYSSAALRERIYSSSQSENGTDMAGILIYTASGDSEGTMGGLVRQGTPYNLDRTIQNALDKAMWCSNDPICKEIKGQGVDSLNLAACHACALASETSCIFGNSILDRLSVIGPDGFLALS